MSEVCSSLSREGNEPLAGTAPETTYWIFWRFESPWAGKPLRSEALDPAVRDTFESLQERRSDIRVQLIRQPVLPDFSRVLMMGSGDPENPWLAHFDERLSDSIPSLDFEAMFDACDEARRANQPIPYEGARWVQEPTFFVCVHSQRDRCCGKEGGALYRSMSRMQNVQVWQTSHLGGHRFAPVVLSMPDGLCFGRVRSEDAAMLIELIGDRRMPLDSLRGRCAWPAAAQAAEIALRAKTGDDRVGAVQLVEATAGEPSVVRLAANGKTHKFTVNFRNLEGVSTPKSCGEPSEPVRYFAAESNGA
ncbi:MAG: sucrase ferredoxin [Polyangiales bacterium]